MLLYLSGDYSTVLCAVLCCAVQVELLKGIGAEFVINSSSDTFGADLVDAMAASGGLVLSC